MTSSELPLEKDHLVQEVDAEVVFSDLELLTAKDRLYRLTQVFGSGVALIIDRYDDPIAHFYELRAKIVTVFHEYSHTLKIDKFVARQYTDKELEFRLFDPLLERVVRDVYNRGPHGTRIR